MLRLYIASCAVTCFGSQEVYTVKTSAKENLRRAQFIASLMRRKFRKKLAPLLFFMSEHKSFWAKRKKLLGSIIGGANYPKGAYGADWRKPTKPTRAKDVGALFVCGRFIVVPVRRSAGVFSRFGILTKIDVRF